MYRAGTLLPTIDKIQRTVAAHYGVPARTMFEPAPTSRTRSNLRPLAHKRQVAIALSVLLTEHSQTRIGYFFGGRDRKTVHHAFNRVARRRRDDPALHETMRRLTLELLRGRA